MPGPHRGPLYAGPLLPVRCDELPDAVRRWERTDAVRKYGVQPDALLGIAELLTRIAREARANNEQMYCKVSL